MSNNIIWKIPGIDGLPIENIPVILCLKNYYTIINSNTWEGRDVWKRKYEVCMKGLSYSSRKKYVIVNPEIPNKDNVDKLRFYSKKIEKYIYLIDFDPLYYMEEQG